MELFSLENVERTSVWFVGNQDCIPGGALEGGMGMAEYKGFSRLLLALLCTAVAGCGGGGGSGGGGETTLTTTPAPTEFNVSGTIQIPAGSVADDDVMQPTLALFQQNNTTSTAQDISNPSVTGGYVSLDSGRYQDSRFSYSADPVDIYSVRLLKGQVVTLVAFPAESGTSAVDLKTSLILRAVDGDPAATLPVSNVDAKSITVTDTDDYYIEVYADEGPVLYLLTVSQGVAAANHSLSMAYDFVPGEVLVKLKESSLAGVSASAFSLLGDAQLNESAKGQLESIKGLTHVAGNSKHGMKMKIDLTVPRATMNKASVNLQDWPEEQREKLETINYIETLKARDDVEWAEPNYIRKAFAETDNPLYTAQWHYPLINVPDAWSVAVTGTGVKVAVIDTGIAGAHADFQGKILNTGYDFVSLVSIAGDGDGLDDNPEDMGGSFHGSHVAGTIAAANNMIGGVGVAYGADIMPLRVLGIDGSGNDADIAQAILYAAGIDNDSGVTLGGNEIASIINLSLGGSGFSNSLKSAVDAAVNKGIIVVAAAGNENSSVPSYPAAFSNVISVSAVGQTRELAPYSNFGSTINVAAPGGDMSQDANGDGNADGVLSTVNASYYSWFQGTSMAAPHVAGVAALMKQVNSGLTAAEFSTWLASGDITDDLGALGRDDLFGYGLINASKAVEKAGQTIPAFLSINPQSMSFDGLDTSSQLTLAQGGTGSVVVTEISAVDNEDPADNWLTVDPAGVTGDGLRTYTVNVNRSGKGEGTSYSGKVTVKFTVDGGVEQSKAIPVLMTVPDPSKVATVGDLFVGLIERSKQEAAENALNQGQESVVIEIFEFQAAQENQGTYTYSFDDVPIGDYYVFASTNMDQDGLVSDLGEAQGDYPVVGDPTLIEVRDADISELNFNVGYLNFVEGLSTETTEQKKILRQVPESFLNISDESGEEQVIQKQY